MLSILLTQLIVHFKDYTQHLVSFMRSLKLACRLNVDAIGNECRITLYSYPSADLED